MTDAPLVNPLSKISFFPGLLFLFLLPGPIYPENTPQIQKLLESARGQIGKTLIYDGSYEALEYPNGDVPLRKGVCTDVLVRAYRSLGVDLQKLVHEDMKAHFDAYPSARIWNLKKADPNIDHRRVPNLRAFFKRKGESLSTNLSAHPPRPGELLTWTLPGNLPHIGIVSDKKKAGRPLIIHNIGQGTREEDILDRYELTGRYRFHPWEDAAEENPSSPRVQ